MERRYSGGDIIFKEGEPGLAAFVVLNGAVELFKDGPEGAVRLATLGKGELFGEMGALDNSVRSATAKAKGAVVLDILPRTQFLEMVTSDSDMALKVMTKLVERLRATDERLVAQQTAQAIRAEEDAATEQGAVKAAGKDGGLLDRLFGWGGDKAKAPAVKSQPVKAAPLSVRIAPFQADPKNAVRKALIEALNGLAGIKASVHGKSPLPELSENPDADLVGAIEVSLAWVAAEKADLMLWGGVDYGGRVLVLRLTPNPEGKADRTGVPSPHLALRLPLFPDEPTAAAGLAPAGVDFVKAVVLAALEPGDEAQAKALQTALAALVPTARSIAQNLMGLGAEEQGTIHVALANILAALGVMTGDSRPLDESIDHYRRGVRFLPEPTHRSCGEAHRMMGLALQSLAEREGDADLLERAAEAYRAAAGVLTFHSAPQVWGELQNRLGLVYYRLDLEGGPGEPLKNALKGYQQALKVFTKDRQPGRWAEIMNNLGQTLQLYGEQVGSEDVIRRAIDSCRAALEVRTKEATPLAWAATQNNLGSALFLLSKHVSGSEAAAEAAECFRKALDIYETYGAAKLSEITEKNLRHAESRLNSRKVRDKGLHDWAAESENA